MKGFERLRQHKPWGKEDTQPIDLRVLINESFYNFSPLVGKGFNKTLGTEEEVVGFFSKKKNGTNRLVFRSNYDVYNPTVVTIRIHLTNTSNDETTVVHLKPDGQDIRQTIIRPGTDLESTITNPMSYEEKRSLFKELSESEMRKVTVVN